MKKLSNNNLYNNKFKIKKIQRFQFKGLVKKKVVKQILINLLY